MKRVNLALAALALLLFAAATYSDPATFSSAVTFSSTTSTAGAATFSAAVDASGGTLEIPNGTALPATCSVGMLFADSDSDDCADTGSGDGTLCVCKSTDTWAVILNY